MSLFLSQGTDSGLLLGRALNIIKLMHCIGKGNGLIKLSFLFLQIDPRHRYGHNLHFYYDIWFESESVQPFFYWWVLHLEEPSLCFFNILVIFCYRWKSSLGNAKYLCCLKIPKENKQSYPHFPSFSYHFTKPTNLKEHIGPICL